MKVIFTLHAERKIKQRRLKKPMIIKAITKPDFKLETYSNRYKAFKKFDKLYLAVIYIKEDDKYVTITAHWEKDFNPKKNWR